MFDFLKGLFSPHPKEKEEEALRDKVEKQLMLMGEESEETVIRFNAAAKSIQQAQEDVHE